MIVFINERNEIKDVNETKDETLTPIEVEDGAFKGWCVAKICCFKVILRDGEFCGFTPYIDSRIIEHIDRLGSGNEKNASDVVDTQMALTEAYDQTLTNSDDITDMQLALAEVYELMDSLL